MPSSISSTGSSRPKNHICDFPGCEKGYSKPSLLEQHKRSHTGERPFVCNFPDCDKSFLRKSHLQAHELSHKTTESKPFHCSICGKGVNTAQHLKRHQVTHEKSFKCTFKDCDEAFYKHQTLRHHILSVHEKSLNCKICNKTFNRPYRLAQHNLKYHSETPTYQCEEKGCFKNFKTWSALQLHIKTDHPKIKCSVCGKGCVGRQGLISHMLTHDDNKTTKLWACEFCNGKFVKKLELIKHYSEFHDGNLPEDLLDPKEKLEEDEDSTLEPLKMQHLQALDDKLYHENTPDDSAAQSVKSLQSLNSALSNGSSIFDILSAPKKISCPKPKCDRMFSRDYDLQRHLKWHQRHLARVSDYLASIEQEENYSDNEEMTMNDLIDDELKALDNVRT